MTTGESWKTRLVSLLFVLVAASACTNKVPTDAEVLGEWEKEDDSLPPVNLLLSKEGSQLKARVRLSGVELNGIATLTENELRLTFQGRDDITGEFESGLEAAESGTKPTGVGSGIETLNVCSLF